jgi:hypothetical protein
MIKTQVQIPDELYHKAKRLAEEREWSFAEVMRRGLEYMTRTHPPLAGGCPELPVLPAGTFVEDFDRLDLRALAAEEETSRSL